MTFITNTKMPTACDVIVGGLGAAAGQTVDALAAAGVKVALLEAGRRYDPVAETPMFYMPRFAPGWETFCGTLARRGDPAYACSAEFSVTKDTNAARLMVASVSQK